MKKLLLPILLISFAQYGLAQRAKGNWMAGASILSGNKNSERLKDLKADGPFGVAYKNVDLELNPRLGKFVSNDLVVGAGLRYSYGSTKAPADGQVGESVFREHQLGIEPFARYYFGPVTSKGSLYGEISSSLGTSTSTSSYSTRSSGSTPALRYTFFHDSRTGKKPFNWSVRLAAGTTIMFNQSIGLDFNLGIERGGGTEGRTVMNNRKVFDTGIVETSQTVSTTKSSPSTVIRLGAGVVIFLSHLKKQTQN